MDSKSWIGLEPDLQTARRDRLSRHVSKPWYRKRGKRNNLRLIYEVIAVARAAVEETYLPSKDEDLAPVLDFLAAHEAAGRSPLQPRYFLAGAGAGDQVELPESVYQALRKVLDAMRNGLAVSVVPQSTRLTTQQAADLLNVSRPTVVKLLDEGEIPFQKAGTHRRVLLTDLIEYREQLRKRQYDMLAATRTAVDESNLEETLAELKAARKAVAGRRTRRA